MVGRVVFECILCQKMYVRHVVLFLRILYFPLVDSVLLAAKFSLMVFVYLVNTVAGTAKQIQKLVSPNGLAVHPIESSYLVGCKYAITT